MKCLTPRRVQAHRDSPPSRQCQSPSLFPTPLSRKWRVAYILLQCPISNRICTNPTRWFEVGRTGETPARSKQTDRQTHMCKQMMGMGRVSELLTHNSRPQIRSNCSLLISWSCTCRDQPKGAWFRPKFRPKNLSERVSAILAEILKKTERVPFGPKDSISA